MFTKRWFKRIKRYIALFLLPLFISSACTFTHWKKLAPEKERTDEIVEYKYDISKISSPTYRNPELKIRCTKTPMYKANMVQISRQMEVERNKLNLYQATISIALGLYWIISDVSVSGGIGLIAIGGFAMFVLDRVADDYESRLAKAKFTGKEKKKFIAVAQPIQGESSALMNKRLEITFDGICKTYCTNNSGEININMRKDFYKSGKLYLAGSKKMKVWLKVNSISIVKEFILNSANWTVKSAKITRQGVQVETEKSNKLVTIGYAIYGNIYEVLHEGDMVKIRLKDGREGYIAKEDCTIGWGFPDN